MNPQYAYQSASANFMPMMMAGGGLAAAAQHLQNKGRNGDSMLVHMTPGEVGGLQALAMAHGGSMSVNPQTGLPEANFLKNLLPTIIGAGLNFMFPGSGTLIGLGVGALETARTGNLGKGIMAGLGAFGGAGMANALTGASSVGAQALGQTAAEQSIANQAAAAGIAPSEIAREMASGFAPQAGADIARQSAAQEFAKQGLGSQLKGSFATLGQPGGFSNLSSNLMTQYGGKYGAMAAATPTLMGVSEALTPKTNFPITPVEKSNYAGPYTPTERQVRFKRPDDESTSEFTFFTPSNPVPGFRPYYAAEGGLMDTGENPSEELAEGGKTEERGPVRMPGADYVAGTSPEFMHGFRPVEIQQPAASITPASIGGKGGMPGNFLKFMIEKMTGKGASNYTDLSGYEYDPQTQQLVKKAGGGLTALAGGRYLQGAGDGTSDSIPATIGAKQPARLADGEFVIDARTVSEIGNGSSNAGAKKLYAMMDRVHKARKKAGRGQDSKAERYLPA